VPESKESREKKLFLFRMARQKIFVKIKYPGYIKNLTKCRGSKEVKKINYNGIY